MARKLTVRLDEENLDFIKRYAAEHGLTVTEMLDRYLSHLREGSVSVSVHADVEAVSGLVPADVDAEALDRQRLYDKHR
jgi:uncharacterized protein involved in type VI secretion and phage assembly